LHANAALPRKLSASRLFGFDRRKPKNFIDCAISVFILISSRDRDSAEQPRCDPRKARVRPAIEGKEFYSMPGHQMTSIARRLVILSAFLLLAATPQLKAQTTSGTLLGTVRDKAGRGVLETKITIENEENGNRRATRTDERGSYTIFNLPPGTYKITATKDGFREQTIEGFPIQFNQKNVVRLPLFTLQTGALKGKVIDTAGNALPGARIIIVGKGDKVTHETVADKSGFYSVPDLAYDLYTVTISWAGRRGELVGVSSIILTAETEDTNFVSVLFLNRQPGLDTLSSRLGARQESPGVTQTAKFRHPADREIGRVISDAWLGDRESNAAPRNKRKAATAGVPKPGQTTPPSYQGAEAAALVNTTDAARSSNFSERQINSLPVGGAAYMRSFDEFALLVAGVAPPPYTPGVRGPGVGFGIGTAGQFSVNGMRARSNNFSIDGSDNNDPDVGVRRQGFVAFVPQSIESVKEFSISTLLWDAELGRNFGSQVNAVSRYGGNKYHGQLFGLFTDSRLNARNFFDTRGKTPFTRTEAGGTLGGPIVRNRTQFFISFERDIVNVSSEQHFSSPSIAERSFFGGALFAVQPEFGPAVGAFIDTLPLGDNVLSFYPVPNNPAGPYGANTFTQILPADGRANIFSFKLTHQFTTNNSLNARYNFTNDDRVLPSVKQAIRSTLDSKTRSQDLSLIFDSGLSRKTFSQARFSYGRTVLDFLPYPGSPLIFSSSSTDFIPSMHVSRTGPIGELLIEPFSSVGVDASTFPQRRVNNTFQFAETLSTLLGNTSIGNHAIKLGANIRYYQFNTRQDRFYRPQVVYGPGFLDFGNIAFGPPSFVPTRPRTILNGVQLASLGVASSVLQTITRDTPNSIISLRTRELHLFFNDNGRVRPNLTIDVGIRYEYNAVPRDANGSFESTSQAVDTTIATTPVLFSYQPALEARAYRAILGQRKTIYNPDLNNFGPHLGLAWSPGSKGTTSIRAGYGIYFDTSLGAVVTQSRNLFPAEVQFNVDSLLFQYNVFTLNNPAFFIAQDPNLGAVPLLRSGICNSYPSCNQYNGVPGNFGAAIDFLLNNGNRTASTSATGLAFTLPEEKMPTAYAQQWHLTFERELFGEYIFSAAYVGTKGTHLTRLITPNGGPNIMPSIAMTQKVGMTVLPFPFLYPELAQSSGFLGLCPARPVVCRTRRPNPDLGAYQLYSNSASSNYHALQLEARKRYGHNYQFTAAYTWSHAIDDVSDVFTIGGASLVAQDSFNLRAERGDANFDIRHRFAASVLWDLPFYRNSKSGAGRLFKNWQIASIFQANTGQPFTLNVAFDANGDGNLTDRPSNMNGINFVGGGGPQRLALAPGRGLADFFTFGQDGAVGRNTARGDNFIDLDLSVSRTFKFGETKNLLFRAEFFNVLNRANFGLPVRVIGAPGFGSAVDTIVPGRTIVFVMKSAF